MADWERMSTVQILEEVEKGGKFVIYQYCVSVLIVTKPEQAGEGLFS